MKLALNNFKNVVLLTTLCGSMVGCHAPNGISDEHQTALASFEIAEGFEIELFAAEPLIADPVAMTVDAAGNMYVVQMHGYPLDVQGSGQVKLLIDTNGDGLPDKASIFADSLILPTGIMAWKKGVLVSDAPHILYLEDTNGDGKADYREIILTGFALSNPQHNVNNPIYGLDNWIYLAHEGPVTASLYTETFGDRGSSIRFPNRDSPLLPQAANGRNVRFKPAHQDLTTANTVVALEALSGESQFGHTFSQWGHHILNSNADHLFHEVIAERYLKRNPALLLANATHDMPDHGNAAEVYPITENPDHQLLTDAGIITSACGVHWYLGHLFPDPYRQVTFTAEPVHNLVHADVIQPSGASFSASRLLEGKEFLASRDAWFRPVNFYTGPDGALYVLDYHRKYIEHPEWMDQETTASGDLYAGSDKGRIYRIIPKGNKPLKWLNKLNLNTSTDTALVQVLSEPSYWHRITAQRLLVERQAKGIAPILNVQFEQSNTPEHLVHMLWTLQGIGALNTNHIQKALKHAHPGLRENAVKLAEEHSELYEALLSEILILADDPDPRVRFQVLCSIGNSDNDSVRVAIQKILRRDIEDPWIHYAALSSSSMHQPDLFQEAILHFSDKPSPGRSAFFALCAAAIWTGSDLNSLDKLILNLTNLHQNKTYWWKEAAWQGLHKAARRQPRRLSQVQAENILSVFNPEAPPAIRAGAIELLLIAGTDASWLQKHPALQYARTLATSVQSTVELRTDALRLLAAVALPADRLLFLSCLQPYVAPQVQKAALFAIKRLPHTASNTELITRWATFTPELRRELVSAFLTEEASAKALLSAIEQGQIPLYQLEWESRVELMNLGEAEFRKRARALFASARNKDDSLLAAYKPALQYQGEPLAGKLIFERNCAACHQMSGELGNAFGPDLSTLRNRQPLSIMTDILLPNRSIADAYDYWFIETRSGQNYAGIIVKQTASTLTLRKMTGEDVVLSRTDIKVMRTSESSAMPAGFEQSISLQQMADLLAFIKNWRSL